MLQKRQMLITFPRNSFTVFWVSVYFPLENRSTILFPLVNGLHCVNLQSAIELNTILPASADVRGAGLIPGLGGSPGGRHGSPLQYSCLENPMDRGAWRATGHGVAKSWTRLRDSLPLRTSAFRLVILGFNTTYITDSLKLMQTTVESSAK